MEGFFGKKHFWQKMVSNKVPKLLWYYGLAHKADILSNIAHGKTGQNGWTLTSMIVCGGSIRSTIQQRMIILTLVDGSVYHTRLGAACDTGY